MGIDKNCQEILMKYSTKSFWGKTFTSNPWELPMGIEKKMSRNFDEILCKIALGHEWRKSKNLCKILMTNARKILMHGPTNHYKVSFFASCKLNKFFLLFYNIFLTWKTKKIVTWKVLNNFSRKKSHFATCLM
jgi:hypothetical protein